MIGLFKKYNMPFPPTRGFLQECYTVLLTTVICCVVLVAFQPFELDEVGVVRIVAYCIASLVLSIIFFFMLYQFVCLSLEEKDWKVWKELAKQVMVLIMVACCIAILDAYQSNGILDRREMLRLTTLFVIFGIIPITVFTINAFNTLLKKYANEREEVNHLLQKGTREEVIDRVCSIRYGKESQLLEFLNKDVLYIKAQGSFGSVLMVKENGEEQLVPISFTQFTDQIHCLDFEICHRSYFINLTKIKEAISNAQGVQLKLKSGAEVPLSKRIYKKSFLKKLDKGRA